MSAHLTPLGDLLTGGFASFFSITIIHPLYTAKSCLMAKKPIRGFYQGYRPNLLCDLSNQLINYFVFGALCRTTTEFYARPLTAEERMVVSFFPGLASSIVLTSLERVMILAQVRGKPEDPLLKGSSSAFQLFKEIIKVEGIKGLTRGGMPTIFRESVNSACFFGMSFYLYPKIERLVVSDSTTKTTFQHHAITAASCFCSGIIGGGFTTPFDTVKTRMQCTITITQDSMRKVVEILISELASSKQARQTFALAFLARCSTISGSMAIMGLVTEAVKDRLPGFFRQSAFLEDDK